MLEVKFYDTVDDALLKFAVIISESNGKWVVCKHRERDTYEVPGGHREAGEDILKLPRENFGKKQVLSGLILSQYAFILLRVRIVSMRQVRNHLDYYVLQK